MTTAADRVRVAPGTDLRDAPGTTAHRSVTSLLRERHYEEPIALGVFGWAMVACVALGVLGLAWLGG